MGEAGVVIGLVLYIKGSAVEVRAGSPDSFQFSEGGKLDKLPRVSSDRNLFTEKLLLYFILDTTGGPCAGRNSRLIVVMCGNPYVKGLSG